MTAQSAIPGTFSFMPRNLPYPISREILIILYR